NAGTRAARKRLAMQPPVGVPANGGPATTADVTRPEGAKVTTTRAVPAGSPALRQAAARPPATCTALVAAARSKGASGAASSPASAERSTAPVRGRATTPAP